MSRRWLPALAFALAASRASAVGSLTAEPPATTLPAEVRAAVAVHGLGATVWVGATLDGAADKVVWIVPIAPGTAVDRASSAFFDALEDATAPRIIAPKGCGSDAPEFLVEGGGDAPPRAPDAEVVVLAGATTLAGQLEAWGVAGDDLPMSALDQAVAQGNLLLAVLMTPEPGLRSTPTLRLSGPSVSLPLAVFRADSTRSVPGTLFAIGAGNATLPGVPSATVGSSQVSLAAGTSNYGALRDAFLAKGRVVLESSSSASLTRPYVFPGGSAPSVADAFLVRAFARGELAADLGAASSAVHAAYAATLPEPCPRGDLVKSPCSGQDPLAKSLGPASDLAFVLAGAPDARVLTRFAFEVPKGGSVHLPMPIFAPGDDVSPLRFAPEPPCTPPGWTQGGGHDASGGGHDVSGDGETAEDSGDSSSSSSVGVQIADGCSGGGSDSCSSDSSSSGGDSCSSSSGGGDSCSSSSGGGDSCSGGGGGGGGSGGCDCTLPRRKQKPALWVFAALALALPIRRASRPA